MIKKLKRTKGFGILEVLLAGVIIIIILGALVFLARNAINNAQYMQERAQAANLAQEGVEIVRQIRDTNYIDKKPETKWDTMVGNTLSVPFGTVSADIYYIDYNTNTNRFYLTTIAPASSLNVDGINFTRTVSFTNISSGSLLKNPDVNNSGKNGAIVKVKVTWPTPTPTHTVEIEELITNSRFVF